MGLDNLYIRQPACCLLGELHHQNRTDREVRGDQPPYSQFPRSRRKALARLDAQAGSSDHWVNPSLEESIEVTLDAVRLGEINGHMRLQLGESIREDLSAVHTTHQLEVRCSLNGRYGSRPHSSPGTDHDDSNHDKHLSWRGWQSTESPTIFFDCSQPAV